MLKLSKNLGHTLPMLFVVCEEGKGMCGFKKVAQMQICFKAFVHDYSQRWCKVASLLS